MATPHERLAASLSRLQELQRRGRRVFRSGELTRVHRERLVGSGFLREVIPGWLISWSPDAHPGDTTPWFASFWDFCSAYCSERFGSDWHLSADQSLLLHAENSAIPRQVICCAPRGANNRIDLLFGTSLFDLRVEGMPAEADLMDRDGLRLLRPESALVRVPEGFYARFPVEARVALAGVGEAGDVLRRLLEGGHSVVAGRLAGAFRRVGRGEVAEEIRGVMKGAGYDVRESDPFGAEGGALRPLSGGQAPIVGRLHSLWEAMREPVVAAFPKAPGLPGDAEAYLARVDEVYRDDAYHSLSIEGYRVTSALLDRVRAGDWDPDGREADRRNRDALAARGYWQAFRLVRRSVGEIFGGTDPGALVRKGHGDWYRELFQPGVAAGLISASDLAGYRSEAVFLRGSRHVPPRPEAVRDAVPALFDLLENEPEASVRAVLGHWLFGYIHPYPDGNGRLARFIANAMLASGGYPWSVIRVEDRREYMDALEAASIDQNIVPFARFVSGHVASSPAAGVRAT